MHGVQYVVVEKEGSLEWKSQAGFLYVDGLMESQVVCINGEVGRRTWKMRDYYYRRSRIILQVRMNFFCFCYIVEG